MYFVPYDLSSLQKSSCQEGMNTMWIGAFLFVLFLLLFFFRDRISQIKEQLKIKIRESLKPMFFKVEGNTVHDIPEGPMKFVWEYLDMFFLKPSEAGTEGYYDYLPNEDDEGSNRDSKEGMQNNESDDDDDDDDESDDGDDESDDGDDESDEDDENQ